MTEFSKTTTAGSRRAAHLAIVVALTVVGAIVLAPAITGAAELKTPLFDRFSLNLEGSYVNLKTQIRLDSETLGQGTSLSFEDDLDLGKNEGVYSLAFAWQIGGRHRLAARYQDVDRSATSQSLTEIRWGDEVIPIESNIALAFDLSQFAIDYAYYPWLHDRWAAGFGLGVRVLDLFADLSWQGVRSGDESADGTGPLPYVNFEYRRLLSDHWRLLTKAGWLEVKIGDIEGGQWIASAIVEYLAGNRWAFGAGVNAATLDVDWQGLKKRDGSNDLSAHVDLDIWDLSFHAKLRF